MQIRKFHLFFPIAALFLLIILKIKEYNVWQQILDGYSSGSALIYLDNLASHTVRLILMHPVVFFSESFNLDLNIVFTFVVFGVFIFINFRVYYWCNLFLKNKGGIKTAFIINSILLFFFLIINGRNSFSFLANVILFDAYLIIYNKNKIILPMFLAFLAGFFCNVSSGTYAVMVINVVLCFTIIMFKRPFSRLFFQTFMILICSVGIFSPVMIKGFIKNLEYYDNSIINMLNHGYGKIITSNSEILILIIPIGFFIFLVVLKHILESPISKLVHLRWSYLISSLLGGLFGYSSLVGALPVLLFLFFITYKTSIKF
tara:strand:+ start:3124 stop:4071 length:948 start_codon:yes stop_codon:yes gene_type:complete